MFREKDLSGLTPTRTSNFFLFLCSSLMMIYMSMNLLESSLNELYRSVVQAFPTTKRQYATNPIVITRLEWTPFLGMRTLRVKGLAQNRSNGHEYSPEIVFKNVQFHPTRDIYGLVEVVDSIGDRYLLERLSYEDTQVLIRCNCGDFYWRMNYADHLSHDLAGRKRKKYEALYYPGSANPGDDKGMCKHIMKLMKVLGEANLIS